MFGRHTGESQPNGHWKAACGLDHEVVQRHEALSLTRNVNKEADFINGMEVTVQDYAKASRCETGRHLAIYPITDWVKEAGYVTAYPMRPGYASTIHKLQGAELKHITIWLERRDARAAAYVAMSRVQRDSDYLIGGQVTRRHFTPAM